MNVVWRPGLETGPADLFLGGVHRQEWLCHWWIGHMFTLGGRGCDLMEICRDYAHRTGDGADA